MALTWDLSKTPFHAWNKKEKDKAWGYVEGMIFFTMAIDMDLSHGEKDIDEFLWRARCYELAHGAYFTKPCKHKRKPVDQKPTGKGHTDPVTGVKAEGLYVKPALITRRHVEPFAGMSTNVARKSRAGFMNKVKKSLARDVATSLRREREEKVG